MHSLTLYFLGAARPLYIESGDYDGACAILFNAIRNCAPDVREQVETWAREIDAQRGRLSPHSAMSCEHGALGLSWRYAPQDRAFAARMADLEPAFPGLDYRGCISGARWVIESKGRRHQYATIDAAKACAADVFKFAGVVIGIERADLPAPVEPCQVPGCDSAGPGGICDSCLPGAIATPAAATEGN